MAEGMEIEYQVTVTGLEEATASANDAKRSADQTSAALENTGSQGIKLLPIITNSFRALTNARQAIEQTQRAIKDLNPMMAMSAFINMTQVVGNLTSIIKALKASTAAASAAQAILATLAGAWWLIPLALIAGALVYSRIQSMQTGGQVRQTGLYFLHKGEEVFPASAIEVSKTTENTSIYNYQKREFIESKPQVRYGPIYITFDKQPREGPDTETWMRQMESRIRERVRRGG